MASIWAPNDPGTIMLQLVRVKKNTMPGEEYHVSYHGPEVLFTFIVCHPRKKKEKKEGGEKKPRVKKAAPAAATEPTVDDIDELLASLPKKDQESV
jgi:hypothetical protein